MMKMTINTLVNVGKAMKITAAAANILRMAAIAFAVYKVARMAFSLLGAAK